MFKCNREQSWKQSVTIYFKKQKEMNWAACGICFTLSKLCTDLKKETGAKSVINPLKTATFGKIIYLANFLFIYFKLVKLKNFHIFILRITNWATQEHSTKLILEESTETCSNKEILTHFSSQCGWTVWLWAQIKSRPNGGLQQWPALLTISDL